MKRAWLSITWVCFIHLNLSSLPAKADLLLEPFAGYHSGTASFKSKSGVESEVSDGGLAFQGRGAYSVMGFFFGLDAFFAKADAKYSKPAGTKDTESQHTAYYIVAGYEAPVVPLRAWLGYALAHEWGLGNSTFSGGSNIKLGIGFTFLPLISLNLEYFKNDFGSLTTTGGTSTSVGQAYDSFNASSLFLSASLPLRF